MNTVILHIEYLLRHHDCVVLPGWGAFIAHHTAAYFYDKGETLMMPPSRKLAFNPDLRQDDGLLTNSVCRRDKLTYTEAQAIVRNEVEYLREQLAADGELAFGTLGVFTLDGEAPMRFYPASGAVNYLNVGLEAITPEPVARAVQMRAASTHVMDEDAAPVVEAMPPRIVTPPPVHRREPVGEQVADFAADTQERVSLWSRLRRNAVGIAATVAVLLTVGLFFYNPISLDNEPDRASIAPAGTHDGAEADHDDLHEIVDASLSEPEVVAGMDVVSDSLTAGSPGILPVMDGEHSTSGIRFEIDDPYCIVVASYTDEASAKGYVASRQSGNIGVVEADGTYFVYEATAPDCSSAYEQKNLLGNPNAWVCMK